MVIPVYKYNHFNFHKYEDTILMTNDAGRFIFLEVDAFRQFIRGSLESNSASYEQLKENGFLIDEPFDVFAAQYTSAVRSMKSYLFSSTALHIFAVTNTCNLNCVYCQAKDIHSSLGGMMSLETGRKAIELAMQSPCPSLTFEFQGGEPLLNFDTVLEMIRYSRELNENCHKDIQYTIVSNLISLTEEKLQMLLRENVSICTSLDGCALVHNKNRDLKSNGSGSFPLVMQQLKKLKEMQIPVGAIETTTRFGLSYPKELVDTYIEAGIHSIFIRPMTPLGFAKAYWDQIGYSPEEYLFFYRTAFDYILSINQAGHLFPELQAVYFLKKILTGTAENYMELRSPCGAGVGQLSYYYDGSVYTCDEGRMISESGDTSFRLGNVYTSTYNDLMESQTCKSLCAASVVEALPHCCDCVYHPYCGVCPIVSYVGEKDIFPRQPFDFRCKVYSGILDLLFEKIRSGDKEIMDIFYSWIENC